MVAVAEGGRAARASQLAKLIEEQAADMKGLPGRGRVMTATDCEDARGDPVNFDDVADHRGADPAEAVAELEAWELKAAAGRRAAELLGIRLKGLNDSWTAEQVAYDGKGPCPTCGAGPLPRRTTCLVCSAGDDGRRHPNKGKPPKRRAAPKVGRSKSGKRLAGGTGKRRGRGGAAALAG